MQLLFMRTARFKCYFYRVFLSQFAKIKTIRPFGYEKVYLPLCKVADTPFHIQEDELLGNVSHCKPHAIVNKSYLMVGLLVSGNVIYSWPQLS